MVMRDTEKEAWNLSINIEVKRLMQIHCVNTKQEISTLTESLYVKYMEENNVLDSSRESNNTTRQ